MLTRRQPNELTAAPRLTTCFASPLRPPVSHSRDLYHPSRSTRARTRPSTPTSARALRTA